MCVAVEHVSPEKVDDVLKEIKVHPAAFEIFMKKSLLYVLRVRGLEVRYLHYLKEDAISSGADVAIPGFIDAGNARLKNNRFADALIIADLRKLEILSDRLLKQPVSSLRKVGAGIKEFLLKVDPDFGEVRLPHGKSLKFGKPIVMGALNVTPDSFYDGGKYNDVDRALDRAEEMIHEGAKIIDVGGVSTRPGAEPVPESEELSRVLPIIERLSRIVEGTDVVISIDTYNSSVARAAIERGASIINDISGGTFDTRIRKVAAETGSLVIVQHIKGTPRDMQKNPTYEDLMYEIKQSLLERVKAFIEDGMPPEKIVIDPGIGFGKKWEHNYEILKRIDELRTLGFPVLVGHSRKSFLGALTGFPPGERLIESLAVAFYLFWKGVDIVRTHDVEETVRVMRVAEAIKLGELSSTLFKI